MTGTIKKTPVMSWDDLMRQDMSLLIQSKESSVFPFMRLLFTSLEILRNCYFSFKLCETNLFGGFICWGNFIILSFSFTAWTTQSLLKTGEKIFKFLFSICQFGPLSKTALYWLSTDALLTLCRLLLVFRVPRLTRLARGLLLPRVWKYDLLRDASTSKNMSFNNRTLQQAQILAGGFPARCELQQAGKLAE